VARAFFGYIDEVGKATSPDGAAPGWLVRLREGSQRIGVAPGPSVAPAIAPRRFYVRVDQGLAQLTAGEIDHAGLSEPALKHLKTLAEFAEGVRGKPGALSVWVCRQQKRLEPTMTNHDHYSDDHLRQILREVRLIAMVGASPDWNRPSYFAMKYLQDKGFRVIPVNPKVAGGTILGELVYADLADLPLVPDMVDIFRNSAAAGPLSDQAIALGAKVVWMQLGVRHEEAAARAEAAGLRVIMNRCPKIEYMRLFGELGWQGINTGVLTSRRRPLTRTFRKLV